MSRILPLSHQPGLPLDRLILDRAPGADAIEMDVVFVGAGPAGLAGAIELARLAQRDKEAGGGLGELNVGVLEKAGSLGEHNLSGAVVNPIAFRELFPEMSDSDFPFRQPVSAESVYLLRARSGRARSPRGLRDFRGVGRGSSTACPSRSASRRSRSLCGREPRGPSP